MDLGVLEETIRLSTTAQDAVLYLCNCVSFADLVMQALFPELSDAADSYDLSVLTEGQGFRLNSQHNETVRRSGSNLAEEVGLVQLDCGLDSLSSNRISSSNSTIRFENSGPPGGTVADLETRSFLFMAAGCGYWEEAVTSQNQAHRKGEQRTILTALDILGRITLAVELCIRKCKSEHNAQSSSLLMDWVVRTGIWKYTPDSAKLSTICNGRADAQNRITQILASHARRSGKAALARVLTDWLDSQAEFHGKDSRVTPADYEDVFVVDPRRMTMLGLAQLLTQLNWQSQIAGAFQLTDRHLVRPLMTVCLSNSVVAARLFASFEQLPKICARLHQEANAQGLDECFKLLFPKDEEWSLANLPTSIVSATQTAAAQWWESSESLATLAHVVRGTSVPFSSLLCALVAGDDSDLLAAIEEAFVLFALVDLSPVSLDPKRKALLTGSSGLQRTSREWCLGVFNSLCRKYIQIDQDRREHGELLIKRTAASLEELKLLKNVLTTAAEEPTAVEMLSPRVIWRTLCQAAANENQTSPPSLTRYISPELLAECPNAIAPLMTAFNLWWQSDSSAMTAFSFLLKNRGLLSEHACRVSSTAQSSYDYSSAYPCAIFERATVRLLDTALLGPTMLTKTPTSCEDFTLTTLYFLVCGEDREFMVDQLVQSSTCLRPSLLRCLWTGEHWGPLLKEMLINYCGNSEESVHMMSVCTLLSAFPSYFALDLVKYKAMEESASGAKTDFGGCRGLRGQMFLSHSIGGLLSEYTDPMKLLSLHAARELLKSLTGQPEMGPCKLRFDAALCAVYESGKRHLNVLGLALSESVRLLLTDQVSMLKELESKCQRSLLKCVELADQTRQQVHDVCLSSTLCDICGLLLTQHSMPPDTHVLEQEAFEGKVCAMRCCDHRYHAICLRSLTIALAPDKTEFLKAYTNILQLFDSFCDIKSETNIRADLVKNLQNLVSKTCPLCTSDLTIAI